MPTFLLRQGRMAGALLLIAALAACPGERTEQEDRAEIGAEYEDANVLADLNGHLAASIEAAEVARERATNAEVRQLAQTLESDHQQKQQQLANLMQQHNLMGVEPDATGAIGDHVDDVRNLRERQAGEEFDRAYLDKVVDHHNAMLNRIDNAIDRTERLEFRSSLQEFRPQIAQHQLEAEQLRERLRNAGTTTTTGTGTGN